MTERPLAIIPVKSFELAKSRLAGALDDAQRRALGVALAAQTALAARDAGADVIVIAGADEVRAWAQRVGFAAVPQPPDRPGLNGAAALGVALGADNGRRAVVLHADLPLITAAALRAAFREAGPVIAPSHDGGTSLLGGVPSGFPFAYGPGSYAAHLSAIPSATAIVRPELALDIDSAPDLERTIGSSGGRWVARVIGATTP